MMEPLNVAQSAFAALPGSVREYYYRGDSACHEKDLVNWLRNEKREGGPPGRIGFALSARMSEALHVAIQAVPEAEWQPYGDPQGEEIRKCTDVPFVPDEKAEEGYATRPLRRHPYSQATGGAVRRWQPGAPFRGVVEPLGVAGRRLDRLAPREVGHH